ncbi:unnamed protein product [Rotaria sordida]|uniref:Cytochrome P450 n=1 Tax=Rotaria sordida TaxID=392033 RepID=A0A814ZI46_9BILA|nr:unnamed protein product [Rotaria sordida]CAF3590184.1 unnamed protein product [Rotaria sordida]
MSESSSKCPISFTVVSPHGTIATASNPELHTRQDINDEQLNQNERLLISSVFPFQRSFPSEPPIEYNRLRAEQPICRATLMNGDQVWLITRFGDVCLVLGDDEHFSKVQNHSNFSKQSYQDIIDTDEEHASLLNMDPTKHIIYREIIENELSIDRIKEYEPRMKNIVDDLLNELINQNPPIDFVSQFAIKVPSFIIYDLLGINKIDHEFLVSRNRINNKLDEAQTANKELLDYINRLIANKKQTPGSDIISRLIIEQLRPGRINEKELVSIILLLLQGANEPIKNLICLGIISLLQNHEQLDQLRENLSSIDAVVEEILRYHTGLSFITHRLTMKDVKINGQIIKTGETLFALNASANRDEQVFTDSDRFDIFRPPQHHLSFGYGTHQCVAMHLVRAQLKTVFIIIFQRLPNLKLAQSIDDIQFINDPNKDNGVQKMLVTW